MFELKIGDRASWRSYFPPCEWVTQTVDRIVGEGPYARVYFVEQDVLPWGGFVWLKDVGHVNRKSTRYV
ncbi:MAG: hypothetical protein P4L79_09990 [Legionella sp.]|uniref:hypothetical protein n=1 Tax=Legionella sp. TaxID=459 RepID=UPI002841DCAB|nr:hypothetical protein [Legionella sp.]